MTTQSDQEIALDVLRAAAVEFAEELHDEAVEQQAHPRVDRAAALIAKCESIAALIQASVILSAPRPDNPSLSAL